MSNHLPQLFRDATILAIFKRKGDAANVESAAVSSSCPSLAKSLANFKYVVSSQLLKVSSQNLRYGIPSKFISLLRQFHGGVFSQVRSGGEVSGTFPVAHGVKKAFLFSSRNARFIVPWSPQISFTE